MDNITMELTKTYVDQNGDLVYISGGLKTNIKGIASHLNELIWIFYVKL